MVKYKLVNVQYGEAGFSYSPLFDKNLRNVYILLDFKSDSEVKTQLLQRSKALLNDKNPHRCPHITLMNFYINKQYDKYLDDAFAQTIVDAFKRHLQKETLISPSGYTSNEHNYYILGSKVKNFTRAYELPPDRVNQISSFRTEIYNYLQSKIGQWDIETYKDANGNSFWSLKLKNKPHPSIYIRDIYYGKGNWKPHITLANQYDISNNNSSLYSQLLSSDKRSLKDDTVVRDTLFDIIYNKRLTPLKKELPLSQFGKITVSFKDDSKKDKEITKTIY